MDIIPNTYIEEFINEVESLKGKPIVQQIRVKPITVQTSLTILIPLSLSTDKQVDNFVQETITFLANELDLDITKSQYISTHSGASVLIDLYHEI